MWDEHAHSDGLLLRGKELREAESWANANCDCITPLEREYLDVCLKARANALERTHIHQRLRNALMTAMMIACMAIFFMVMASIFGRQAYIINQQAKAQELAEQSDGLINSDKKVATVLAYEALKNYPYTGEAEAALGKVISPAKKISFASLGGKILDINLSADGSTLAAINDNGVIQNWNANTGQSLKTVPTDGPITFAVFSFDGKKIIICNDKDMSTSLWDSASGKQLVKYDTYSIDGVNFSPDGTRVATTSKMDGYLSIWDTNSGILLSKFPRVGLDDRSLSFNSNGSQVLGFEDGEARIWNVSTRKKLFSLGDAEFIAFSSDGTHIAAFAQESHDILIWDAINPKKDPIITIPFSKELIKKQDFDPNIAPMDNLVFNPDNSRIIAGIDSSNFIGAANVSIWDLNSGQKLATLSGNSGPITRAIFSPDGVYVATASKDHTVRVWDIQSQGEIPTSGERHSILTLTNDNNAHNSAKNIVFSPDNAHVIILWDDGQIDSWHIPLSRLELLSIVKNDAKNKCGTEECELTYDQRIIYDVHNWPMLVYDYSDYFFCCWIGFFYIILGWTTYRNVFAKRTALPQTQKIGFTWMRFLSSGLISGISLILFMAGLCFILMPENSLTLEYYNSLDYFPRAVGVSNFLLPFVLPILLWPGGVYCHKTRFQLGKWVRAPRVVISVMAGITGIVMTMVIIMLILIVAVIFVVVLDLPIVVASIPVIYLVLGALFALILVIPLNLLGALLYTLGLQPLAIKWRTQTHEDDNF